MGGKCFAKPASRLTTAQLDTLTSYCQDQLANTFTRVERLRCISSKTSHGDLDLLCAFDDPAIRFGQAQVGFSSDDDATRCPKVGRVAERRDHAGETMVESDKEMREANDARVRRFCDDVCAALGANGWVIAFYGYPIIALRVPFWRKDTSAKGEEERFWQVDVALAPAFFFDAYLFSCSYNIPYALLVLATQALSPSFRLKRDALCLRHRPFFGQPLVELTLIDSRCELYCWLGLDMAVWDAGFDTYESIYRWITQNPAGSALSEAWDRVATGQMDGVKVDYKRFHTRADGVPEFIAWLTANREVNRHELVWAGASSRPSEIGRASGSDAVSEIPLDDIIRRLLIKSGRLSEYEDSVKLLKLEVERIALRQERQKANRLRAKLEEERSRALRVALASPADPLRTLEGMEDGSRAKGGDAEEQQEQGAIDQRQHEGREVHSA